MNRDKEKILRVYLVDHYIVGREEFLKEVKELSYEELDALRRGEVIYKDDIEFEVYNWDGI